MRRITVATMSIAASLALAACAERDTTSPRSISAGQASFQGGPNSTACDFTNISKAAKNYFTSSQDPVYAILSSWATAYKNNGAAAATSYGWQALSVVASERLTSSTTTPSLGATFVVMTVRCMVDESSTNTVKPQLTLPTALTDNSNLLLARVLNSGILEIRTGGAVGDPVAGKNRAGSTPTRSLGSPIWGVETKTDTTKWPGTITYAVVGYPIHDSNSILSGQPQIDTNDADSAFYKQTAGLWPFNAFELTTLPTAAVTDHSSLRVGICVSGNPDGNGSVNFLVHNDNELVPNDSHSQSTGLCGLTVASLTPATWYQRLARNTVGLFTPSLLYAEGDDSRDFIGGLPSGWSPMEGGTLDASKVRLVMTSGPTNNVRDSTDNHLTITAYLVDAQGVVTSTPVPQVRIDSLAVLSNNGTPAGAVIVPGSTNLLADPNAVPPYPGLFTDANGQAIVKFQIGKPGAYYIVASGVLDGTRLNDAKSGKFNVKN
jgi:hypothetical protein